MTQQPETRQPTFQPMEWAILTHAHGGRIMQVETTTWTDKGDEIIHEYYVQPGDTKSRYQQFPDDLGYHVNHLIKCVDKEAAQLGAKILKKAYEDAQQSVRAAERRKENVVADAIRQVRDFLEPVKVAPEPVKP